MPRYKVSIHQTGWQTLENFIDVKDEDEAWEKYEGSNWVNVEWKEEEEEYKVTDTEIHEEGDTPTEEVKKWRENREQGHKEWKKELDRIYKEDA